MCKAIVIHLDNIDLGFAYKVYKQKVDTLVNTNCAPLITDLFCTVAKGSCKESNFQLLEAFNDTSCYIDDISKIGNIYLSYMVKHIYSEELELNQARVSDHKPSVLDWRLAIRD